MSDATLILALGQALNADPRNGPLWLHYASLLQAAQRDAEALAALRTAVEIDAVRQQALKALIPLLRTSGALSEALIRAEAYLEADDDADVRAELERIRVARGEPEAPAVPQEAPARAPAKAPEPELARIEVGAVEEDLGDWASQFDWGDLRVTLKDVAGLEQVKRQIRLRILAPAQNPAIYDAFGRSAGGGLLLYGPPGCGKTYVARATAGELGARFVSVSIHEVVDKFWGESEKLIHGLFEHARRSRPTVLFFDEFDALGGVRGRGESQFWKTLVDQLLQELDGATSRNREVLVIAATNVPWNVDSAFRRPGRFDRVLLVTPPDESARRELLARTLGLLPGGERIDVAPLVKRTELFSGADLRAVVERASEAAIERSLEGGKVSEVTAGDVERALKETKSSVLEWIATARNHARYANEGGQYDELVEFLKRIKKW